LHQYCQEWLYQCCWASGHWSRRLLLIQSLRVSVGANAVLSNLSGPVHTNSQGHVFHSLQAK
jgi:hypothetical protein